MVRVKICGVTNSADAQLAAELGAHAIGLNFFPESPRAVSPFDAEKLLRDLPPFVAAVGIFVNWAPEPIIALAQALRLFAVQLHGDETPPVVAEVAKKFPVIKAFRTGQGSVSPAFSRYRAAAAFLLDAADPNQFGGTGKTTDWQFPRTAAASHRIVLAGGLTAENVAEAMITVRPYAVDVASGVESRPGKKDRAKLRTFFAEVARANQLLAAASLDDAFVGTWDLDPTTLNYQFGRPGRRAIYTIESIPQGLRFTLDGDDPDEKPLKFTYGGALDGSEQPLPGGDTFLILTRLSENKIESSLKRDGKIVDRWTRELLPDGKTMRIIQHVVRPGGEKFQNISFYHRRK